MAHDKDVRPDANRDPITDEAGAHPVGTGAGAAGGAATGAALGGAVGGPIGAVVGGTIGAVAGGLAGRATAEAMNPTVEDEYWRRNWKTRPYVQADHGYATYEPAYRYGWESRTRFSGGKWEEAEKDLERDWDRYRGESQLAWQDAKQATRDAWHRVDQVLPETTDREKA